MRNLITALAFLSLVTLSLTGCKKDSDPEPSAAEQAITKLTNNSSITWKVSSVTLESSAVPEYDGSNFSLTLTKTGDSAEATHGYGTSNRPDRLQPWPLSGDWKLGTNVSSQLVRDPDTADELAMTYSVSDSELVISFNFNGNGWDKAGKTEVVEGNWVFTFTK